MVAPPDPTFLTSDWFLDHYCLAATTNPAREGAVAVSFAPAQVSGVADVAGSILVDRESGELESIHYQYDPFPLPAAGTVPGGWMRFDRLPNGAFFVSEWEQQLPQVAWIRQAFATTGVSCPVATETAIQGGHVSKAFTVTGDLLWDRDVDAEVGSTRSRLWGINAALRGTRSPADHGDLLVASVGTVAPNADAAEDGRIVGVVKDVDGLAPIANARVTLENGGSSRLDETDESGRFYFGGLVPGSPLYPYSVTGSTALSRGGRNPRWCTGGGLYSAVALRALLCRGSTGDRSDVLIRLTCGCCCHGSPWSVRGARLAASTHVRPVLPRSRTASR